MSAPRLKLNLYKDLKSFKLENALAVVVKDHWTRDFSIDLDLPGWEYVVEVKEENISSVDISVDWDKIIFECLDLEFLNSLKGYQGSIQQDYSQIESLPMLAAVCKGTQIFLKQNEMVFNKKRLYLRHALHNAHVLSMLQKNKKLKHSNSEIILVQTQAIVTITSEKMFIVPHAFVLFKDEDDLFFILDSFGGGEEGSVVKLGADTDQLLLKQYGFSGKELLKAYEFHKEANIIFKREEKNKQKTEEKIPPRKTTAKSNWAVPSLKQQLNDDSVQQQVDAIPSSSMEKNKDSSVLPEKDRRETICKLVKSCTDAVYHPGGRFFGKTMSENVRAEIVTQLRKSLAVDRVSKNFLIHIKKYIENPKTRPVACVFGGVPLYNHNGEVIAYVPHHVHNIYVLVTDSEDKEFNDKVVSQRALKIAMAAADALNHPRWTRLSGTTDFYNAILDFFVAQKQDFKVVRAQKPRPI